MKNTKICSQCKEKKLLSCFSPTSSYQGRIQYRGDCKPCNAQNRRKRYAENPEAMKAAGLKWKQNNPDKVKFGKYLYKYGLTRKGYFEILEEQNNVCAICAGPLTKPHIDHNHKTQTVRGILCITCNTGLGKFGDSVELLQKAIQYLSK